MSAVRTFLWWMGAPARMGLLVAIRFYRLTLSGWAGGQCRFHPSCSEYAERAIRSVGAVRGTALAVWRVMRCSPMSAGGVDYPPRPIRRQYEVVIHREDRRVVGG